MGACGLHVARARELKREVNAVALALDLELRNLCSQLLDRLGTLGGLGHLALELGDSLVPLGNLFPPVRRAARLLLWRLRLLGPLRLLLCCAPLLRLALRVRLAAIGLTFHEPACPSPNKADPYKTMPAPLSVRASSKRVTKCLKNARPK